ncbi:MAG: cyclic nucleotide-binding domain-containing protein [Roseibium sp.]
MDLSYLGTAGIFVQLALLFYVMGLLTRNELGLRLLLLIGSFFYIIYYYYVSDAPLWDAIWTSAVIAACNIVMICVNLRERSTLGMKPDMIALYQSFPTLNPGQFRRVMRQAKWIVATEDTEICSQGIQPEYLFLLTQGPAKLVRDERSVFIGSGNFVGEISYLIDGPATATVVAPKGSEYVQWKRTDLTDLMEKSHKLSNALSALFNKDIARKLAVSWPEKPDDA